MLPVWSVMLYVCGVKPLSSELVIDFTHKPSTASSYSMAIFIFDPSATGDSFLPTWIVNAPSDILRKCAHI